jgi:hypothetical protein
VTDITAAHPSIIRARRLARLGHWIHMAAIAAPLLIGEFVKDPDKRWRYLRLASVGTALASEAIWTHRLSKDRQKDEDARAALADCFSGQSL